MVTCAVKHWVLLRGLGRGAGHWGSFPSQLQAQFPQATLVLPDLPGNGARFAERSPAQVSALVEDLRHWLHGQGLAPPYHVLALSLGGMVTADWARRHPHELAAAVLLNTSLRPFSPWHHRMRPRALARLLSLPLRGLAAREATVLALTSRLAREPAATLSQWTALQGAQPVSAANLVRQLWAAASYGAGPHRPDVPLLLLAGQRDALVNPRCSATLARQWGLPLLLHPQAGHDLPLDDGEWVARQSSLWLLTNANGAGNACRPRCGSFSSPCG